MKEITYDNAGVDITAEDEVIQSIQKEIDFSKEYIELNQNKFVLCTDGVGSKVIIANAIKKWDTVGIDCIAMNVNDALVLGARPIAFVDYLAMEKMDILIAKEIAKGLKKGADESDIIITGGETATLPEIIYGFDLAGTCLGVVEKVLPNNINIGDVIIGIKSSGIHSNGLTLARKVFTENNFSFFDEIDQIGVIGESLLIPTKIYVRPIISLWENIAVKGIAHITGSGLRKLARLSPNKCFELNHPITPQPLFSIIQRLGNIATLEMYKTFNMGMGMAVVIDKSDVDESLSILNKSVEAFTVGEIVEGNGVTIPSLDISI
jgi:phosphoribosylformylglycinamidine cyclo-ligase